MTTTILEPFDTFAERCLLALVLVDTRAIHAIRDAGRGVLPSPQIFYARPHQEIWRTILQLAPAGVITASEVNRELHRVERAHWAPAAFLADLVSEADGIPSGESPLPYLTRIRELWRARELTRALSEIADTLRRSGDYSDARDAIARTIDTIDGAT